MAKKPSIQYAFPIEGISRKFIQRSQTCGEGLNGQKVKRNWLGGMVKTPSEYAKDAAVATKNFMVVRTNARRSAYTAAELARFTAFQIIGTRVAARLKDPTKFAQDLAAWKNQSTYNTLRKYVWHLEAVAYDEEINP